MDEIKFGELSDKVRNYVINESSKVTKEEILTDAEVKEKIGGAIGAVRMILEDTYITNKLFEKLTEPYNKALKEATQEDREELEKEEQKALANAAYYKMSYAIIDEALSSGKVLYIDIDKEIPYRSTEQLMNKLGEDGEIAFVTIHEEGDKLGFRFHAIAIKEEGFITNSDFIDEAEIEWLDYDYEEYFEKRKKKENKKTKGEE
jgi:hypothetical protein